MKNILLIITCACLCVQASAQAIGYQGKTFVVSGGLSIGSNISAVTGLSLNYTDDMVPETQDFPIKLKPFPQLQIEYVVVDNASIILRWQPLSLDVNAALYDENELRKSTAVFSSKGNIFSIGAKGYFTDTPAPLSNYFSLMAFVYTSNLSVSTHPTFADDYPMPDVVLNESFQSNPCLGITLGFGMQDIFYDRLCVDYGIELSYILANPESSFSYTSVDGNGYHFDEGRYPSTFTTYNARTFMMATPMIHVGYLLF